MSGNLAYQFEPLEGIDEQEMFLSILYHDARGGNAIRLLLGEEEDGKRYVCHFANRDYRKVGYRSTKYNAYTTVNTFKTYKRNAGEVYNFSGIFIDLDGHNFKTEEKMDKAIERTKKRLQKAFENEEISAPTMITHTGRGLGIFYILRTSIANTPKTKKSIKYLDQVRAAITAKYKKILAGTGYLEVDTTVKDNARVCRMPLTMNRKIGRWCRLIHVSYTEDDEVQYYDLKELARINHLFDEINEVRRDIATKKIVSLGEYKYPFLALRMQKLELLQEIRGFECTGTREYMIFTYYNSAKQVYGIEGGKQATERFNQRFLQPLPDGELEHAYECVNTNKAPTGDYEGYYKLPDRWVVESLAVTDEENKRCRFGASKRQIERQQIKESNKSRREERNKEIAGYVSEHPEQKYAEIAAQFGVSESLLRKICKEYGIRRYKALKVQNTALQEASNDVRRVDSENGKNAKFLSNSLLGVPSAALGGTGADIFLAIPETEENAAASMKQDGLVQAYLDLYRQATEKRKKRRKQVPGQIAFRFDGDGTAEFYIVS